MMVGAVWLGGVGIRVDFRFFFFRAGCCGE